MSNGVAHRHGPLLSDLCTTVHEEGNTVWLTNLTPSLLVYVGTAKARNGNPRRGWIAYNSDGDMVAFEATSYYASHFGELLAADRRFPGVVTTGPQLTITAAEYNRLKRWESNRIAEGMYTRSRPPGA